MITLLMSAALAQSTDGGGFDAHGFRLAAHDADPRDPFVGWRPGLIGAHSWFVSGVVEYANQPLVFETDGTRRVIVDNQLALNTSLGYAPHERFRLDLAMPVFLYSEGEAGPIGATLGDLRFTGMAVLVAPKDEGLGLGLVGNLDLPTGSQLDYRGQKTMSGGVGVAVTGELDRVTLSASASTQLRPNTDPELRPAPTIGGDAFTWTASVGYLVSDSSGLTLEAWGEVASDSEVRSAIGVPVEAMLSMKHVRDNGGFLSAGLGVGLTPGAGASPFRLVVGGGFGRTQLATDEDGDGIVDEEDVCPAKPETPNGYKDEDGCPDELPRIEFRAIDPGGEYREDAQISVSGPVEASGEGKLEFQGEGAVPGSEWHVEVAAGNCLFGEADVTMGPDGDVVDVVLARRRRAKVFVEAVDAEGQPVPGAEISFRTQEAPCAPSMPTAIEGGSAEVDVGPGMFFAFVNAPGFQVFQQMFQIEEGGKQTIRAVLKPVLAEVVEKDDGTKVIEIREKVYFDTNVAVIQERSFAVLDTVASIIVDQELTAVEIGGHTDDVGGANSNRRLSRERAEAVKAYLVGKGIDPAVLTAVGYGEDRPALAGTSEQAREANRRVEFKILE